MPEAVTTAPPNASPAHPHDLLQVDTAALVPLLTKAIQDLAAQVADLQAQIALQPSPQSP